MRQLHSNTVYFLLFLGLIIGGVSSALSRIENNVAGDCNAASHLEAILKETGYRQTGTKKFSLKGRSMGFKNSIQFEELEGKGRPYATRKKKGKISLHNNGMQNMRKILSRHEEKTAVSGSAAFDREDYPRPMHHPPRNN